MKIKIIKCSKDSFWYINEIGKIFQVLEKKIDGNYCVERYEGKVHGNLEKLILNEDAEEIKIPKRKKCCLLKKTKK